MALIEKETTVTEPVTGTMKAAVVHGFDAPLTIDEKPIPIPGAGEIVVKIEASGLCHTDIHAAHGDWPVKPSPPFTPGHEGVGIVTLIGPGVTEVAVGDRVALPWLGYACGTCEYCVTGWETLCLEQKNMGYSMDGGFAEYAKAYARYVVKVPEGDRPVRGRTPHLRGRHDLQGREGRGNASSRPRRRLRRRRARAHGDPVRRDRRRPRHRRRRARREARARTRARSRVHRERGEGGPDRGDPEARRRRPGNRAGGLTEVRSSRPSARSSAAARSSSSLSRRRTR